MDASAALALEGVAGYYGASDVPGSNIIGPTKYDEEVFAKDTVTCVGQVKMTRPIISRARWYSFMHSGHWNSLLHSPAASIIFLLSTLALSAGDWCGGG